MVRIYIKSEDNTVRLLQIYDIHKFTWLVRKYKPSHRVCKPTLSGAYTKPDKLGQLQQKEHLAKNGWR